MNKLVMAAFAAAAIFTASAASASELFTIDPTNSGVTVTKDTGFLLGCVGPSSGCALSATPATPFATQSLNVGQSATFDFVNFSITPGYGNEKYDVEATLAFLTPTAGPATTGGTAHYLEFGGFLTGGDLTWTTPSETLTAADGSVFTVAFQDLKGLTVGSNVADDVTITLQSGVPEPASWALMIGGLGLTGFALRRRRVVSAAATA